MALLLLGSMRDVPGISDTRATGCRNNCFADLFELE
jgi:hypothetical protein